MPPDRRGRASCKCLQHDEPHYQTEAAGLVAGELSARNSVWFQKGEKMLFSRRGQSSKEQQGDNKEAAGKTEKCLLRGRRAPITLQGKRRTGCGRGTSAQSSFSITPSNTTSVALLPAEGFE